MPPDDGRDTGTTCSVARLSNVAFEVADLTASLDFYTRAWGLARNEIGAQDAYLCTTASDERVLGLHTGRARRLRAVRFDIAPGNDLERIARAVTTAGGSVHPASPSSDRLRFEDLDGHAIEIIESFDDMSPTGSTDYGPIGLDHVVLEVRDLELATRFFREALGLRLSDTIPGFMAFLRCNANHHSIALRADGTGVDHVAFTVPDWYAVAQGVYRLGDLGVERVWGPGRHGPGNNLFAYFKDPDGNVIEYTAEVEQVNDETWEPREWAQEQGDLWPTGT